VPVLAGDVPRSEHPLQEQAALRRVATLVARGTSEERLFAAVTEQVGRLFGVDQAQLNRYEPDGGVTVVATWACRGAPIPLGTRWKPEEVALGGGSLARHVAETGRAARIDDWDVMPGQIAAFVRELGIRSSVASPIMIAGRLWGYVIMSARERMPEGIELRLEDFTGLVATAVADSEARGALTRLADEQAALRRVATLVAQETPSCDVFAAVIEEVVGLLGADVAGMSRYQPGDVQEVVAAWPPDREPLGIGTRLPVGGEDTLAGRVRASGRPARVDDWDSVTGEVAGEVRRLGVRASVACPIVVASELWGLMIVDSRTAPLPEGTEARLERFTALVATAVANSEARAQLRRLAEEQAALRRVATLVARESAPADLLGAVAAELGALLDASLARVLRYEPDGTATVVAAWGTPQLYPLGGVLALDGDGVAARVLRSGCSARMDGYEGAGGEIARTLLELGVRSSVGAPIVAEDRLWGVVVVSSSGDTLLPLDGETRIAEFTELVATAIANASAREALAASRARVVAAADEARRRIERNLHDGAQQQLIGLALQLRIAGARLPPGQEALREQLGDMLDSVNGVHTELQEISRGLHPAVLSTAGLEPALGALARRSPVPVELDVTTVERFPEPVEVTAYYVASEALANAAKHGRASGVRIALSRLDGCVALEISDDGVGGADPANGSGLIGLRDRVEAVGGTIDVTSPRGEGTTLLARLPTR
jgi:signal transduction histidine kinase